MNQNQHNYLSMFKAVAALFANYEDTWKGIEPIKQTLIDFQTSLILISSEVIMHDCYGEEKEETELLVEKTYALARNMRTYTERGRKASLSENWPFGSSGSNLESLFGHTHEMLDVLDCGVNAFIEDSEFMAAYSAARKATQISV